MLKGWYNVECILTGQVLLIIIIIERFSFECGKVIDLFTDTAAILNSEEIMGYPGGRSEIIIKNTMAW